MPAEKALLALHHWRMQAALPSSRGLQSIMGKIHKNITFHIEEAGNAQPTDVVVCIAASLYFSGEVWHQVQSGAHAVEFRLLFSMNRELSFGTV